MSFSSFGLGKKILSAVSDTGYTEPTEIQSRAIPKILKGFDLRASAQTGTGKTAAFILPALDRLAKPGVKGGRGPRVLVLAPTRELALQIADQTRVYTKYMRNVKTVCLFGGVPYGTQIHQLSKPHDLLVATPGRLLDLMERGKVNLSRVEILVLDEADRMLDMGFIDPVERIVAATPKERQTLLFSATLKGAVVKLSEKLLNNPFEIVVHADHAKHENIDQKMHYVDGLHQKKKLLDHILGMDGVNYTIIFASTKRQVGLLAEELRDQGHRAVALHGDMNQRQRTRTIMQLREGKHKILVATDVAARGLDLPSVTHVINFDLPRNPEDYIHRIGRTGRAGEKGVALSFAAGHDALLVKKIERFTKQKIDVIEIEGFRPRPQKKFSPEKKKFSPHHKNSRKPFFRQRRKNAAA
ncbi:DEAD/DEAH box helicase [Simkania negevensis]|uniref:DEAD/DEAH box helicase n=1 Tax=Simkania negevensis TaxID=83561 RepID=A0ABS3ASL2_9BACT|nr:DEAD/DEAH box helicase [Simkania negevensis]